MCRLCWQQWCTTVQKLEKLKIHSKKSNSSVLQTLQPPERGVEKNTKKRTPNPDHKRSFLHGHLSLPYTHPWCFCLSVIQLLFLLSAECSYCFLTVFHSAPSTFAPAPALLHLKPPSNSIKFISHAIRHRCSSHPEAAMGPDTPETVKANSIKNIRSERRRTGWEAPG